MGTYVIGMHRHARFKLLEILLASSTTAEVHMMRSIGRKAGTTTQGTVRQLECAWCAASAGRQVNPTRVQYNCSNAHAAQIRQEYSLINMRRVQYNSLIAQDCKIWQEHNLIVIHSTKEIDNRSNALDRHNQQEDSLILIIPTRKELGTPPRMRIVRKTGGNTASFKQLDKVTGQCR